MVSRREFLQLAAAGAAGLAVGLGAGYSLRAQPEEAQAKKIKALWVYVGPITDIGWTAAHHEAKTNVQKLFPWLEAKHIEKVEEAQAKKIMEMELQKDKYDAVFATSYGFKDAVKELARKYPEVKFYHCSGEWEEFKDIPNVSTYFAEFYQLYYLNGLAAGAVTESCKVGYVPAFLIPEVVRHINAFAIGAVDGARLMGKCGNGERIEVYSTKPLLAWFAPDKAKDTARYLVDRYNVDVIAFTEDTTAVLDAAEDYMKAGRKVYSFSHYSDMFTYYQRKNITLRSHLTGQVADWTPIYADLLMKLYTGRFVKEDIWARLGDYVPIRWRAKTSAAGGPEGAVYLAPLNEAAIPAKALEAIKRLYEDMKEMLFDPFTGPIRGYKISDDGRPQESPRIKIEEGKRASRDDHWYMDWFHEKVISPA